MMRIFRLVRASILFLLLGNSVVLVPGQAYAAGWCCPNGYCWPGTCICRGTPPCIYYSPDDSDTVQSYTTTAGGASEVGAARDSLAVTTPDPIESVLEVTSAGKCFRDKLALRLLGKAAAALKFEPIRFDEKDIQDRTLAFQIEGEEK